jgi:uncharacterized protein YbjT (DUF2867 family)
MKRRTPHFRDQMKIKAIITGATGMVGEGVLHECLLHPDVESVLVINRRPCGVRHEKLKEIIYNDLSDTAALREVVQGYNACYFCAGVSSVGMKETEYRRITYTLTMAFAEMLAAVNSGMTFCYVSGAGTDSSEHGRIMWARVKGKTENDLEKLPFKQVFNFRVGVLQPTKGLKNTLSFYRYLAWLIPVLRWITPNSLSTQRELGLAMINVSLRGYSGHVLEVRDIKALGNALPAV